MIIPNSSGARRGARVVRRRDDRPAKSTYQWPVIISSRINPPPAVVPDPDPAPDPTVLWRFDPSSNAVDGSGHRLYGLDGRWGDIGTVYTDQRIVGGAPDGGDSVRFTLLGHVAQVYVGGEKAVTPPAWGQSYFHRGRIKYHFGDREAIHTQKLVIIADPGSTNRPIITVGTHFAEPTPIRLGIGLDGGGDPVLSSGLATDVWHSWQAEVNPGTSGGGNGFYRFTVNGVLLGSTTGVPFVNGERLAQGNVRVGFYMNDPVSPSDDFWFELCDIEVGTSTTPGF